MKMRSAGLMAALLAVGATSVPVQSRPTIRGGGLPMSPLDRQKLNAERLRRAPKMLAKAEAKRERKRQRRLAGSR